MSLTPLALWDSEMRTRILPNAADVVLEVGFHAHDPEAVTIGLT